MDNNQLTDMLQVFFECHKNSGQAVRIYAARFPNREVPNRQKFRRIEQNLRNYGAFKKPKNEGRQFRESVELDAILSVQENPRTSTREIAHNIGTSKDTVHKILKKHTFKPYIPQKVQALYENDRNRRHEFCVFYLNMLRQSGLFYRNVLWSDECTFNNNGVFNRSIHRYWSQQNPRVIVETNRQHRFTVNVWCGILGDRLIGPFFIDGTLNQDKYHQLLIQNLDNFLDELPLAELNRVFFQQDGATPHNARINVDWLNSKFGQKWIGTYGPVRWPARSPDLTPLDFWLWSYVQDRVYLTPPENEHVLRERILHTCQEIPPVLILNATQGVTRRCQLCIRQGGRHFEQYL